MMNRILDLNMRRHISCLHWNGTEDDADGECGLLPLCHWVHHPAVCTDALVEVSIRTAPWVESFHYVVLVAEKSATYGVEQGHSGDEPLCRDIAVAQTQSFVCLPSS